MAGLIYIDDYKFDIYENIFAKPPCMKTSGSQAFTP